MKSLTQVKEEYRLGDLETRLNLFLDCPELRKDFMTIEMDQDALLASVTKQPDTVDRTDKMLASLVSAFPLSWQARLRRICCS